MICLRLHIDKFHKKKIISYNSNKVIFYIENMGKKAHFRNLREENIFDISVDWIYQRIKPVFKLISANQITLNNYVPFVR